MVDSIIVLGADRVGKSTLISNTTKLMKEEGFNPLTAHFSSVKPEHNSPTEQFTNFLRGEDFLKADFLLMDRFVPDTLFYEQYRYQLPKIPDFYALSVENELLEVTGWIEVFIITHEWNKNLIERHEKEIAALWPGCSDYWLSAQVEKRRREHEAYYDHMVRYINNITLINSSHVHWVEGDKLGPDSFIQSGDFKLKAM